MSVLAHIGRGVEKQLITAIVETGLGQKLIEQFCEAPGVLSISHHHARGVGSQRIRTGQMFFRERDVVLLLVEQDFLETVFQAVFEAGRVGLPGGGIIFSETVLRGHPMLPFDGADW
ncbi:MAG: nitrogen regulatory protein [Proteobacteria bacterium]|nr:nitrogen regulatory protein [Pseudomonadota bacterium]